MNFKCRRHLVWKKTEKLGKKLGKRLDFLREKNLERHRPGDTGIG